MAGRKSKLNPELLTQIEISLQNHNSVKATCDLLGISQAIWYRWFANGERYMAQDEAEQDEPPETAPAEPTVLSRADKAFRTKQIEFVETVKRCSAMSKISLINKIQADPSWQAKAWILERQHPAEFGRRQLIAHAGADGQSDMPAATAVPVKLILNIKRPDDSPWIYAAEQDQEPSNGSDPWEQDQVEFKEPMPEPLPLPTVPMAPQPAPNTRPAPVAAKSRRNSLDGIEANHGRPTDPDA